MTHLAEPTATQNAKDNSFLDGLPELILADDGHAIRQWHVGDETAAVINNADGKLSLTFTRNIKAPLVVHMHSAQARLMITVASDVDIHLVLVAHGQSKVSVNIRSDARCHLYLVPAVNEQLNLVANIEHHAAVRLFEFGAAAAICRRDLTVHLAGTKAQFYYVGLDQLMGVEHKQTHLVIKHQESETKSSQLFRGIYNGEASGSFLGQVVIEHNAGNSSAQQLYKATILSHEAKAEVKPELVIDNHDISASHGATIGELDKEALFYLCSRGLRLHEAKALLIDCITKDLLNTIAHPSLRARLTRISTEATLRLLRDLS